MRPGPAFDPKPGPSPRTTARIGGLGAIAITAALLMIVPIAAVLGLALFGSTDTWVHLASTVLPGYVWTTALLAVGVAVGVITIGVLSAWLVVHYRFPGRGILEWALVLPLAMPAYVIAYAYTDWLTFAGPVQSALRELTGWQAREYWFPDARSLPAAALMFALVLYPYVYLLVRTSFVEQSASTLEAARLAGLGAISSLVRIGVPLARPAIAAGTALVMMETLADFGAVSYFGIQTFTTGIFRAWQSFGDRAAAAQLAAVLFLFVAVILVLEHRSRGRARFQAGAVARPVRPQPLAGWRALVAFTLCAAPVVLGFVLPSVLLVRLAVIEDAFALGTRELGLVLNSVILSGIAALLAVAVAILLAYAGRNTRSRAVAAANRIAALGYAIPGAVIAVGVLVPLGRLDNLIADSVRAQFDVRIGLVFTGSIVALVYAYLVRYLAVAMQSVDAGLARITPSMDDAARSLGLGARATLVRVHAPLLRASVLTAALLVFVDVMKELPATFALRPFDYDTLAVHIYNLAKDERLGEAALPSLFLVGVGLLPVILLCRQIARRRSSA